MNTIQSRKEIVMFQIFMIPFKVPDKRSQLFPKYACLNNAERFYYLLQKLLKKRGKNDFAIKIKLV